MFSNVIKVRLKDRLGRELWRGWVWKGQNSMASGASVEVLVRAK